MNKEESKPDIAEIANGNNKDKKIYYYTGEKTKSLVVHMIQNGVEVDKPINTKTFSQSVEWNKRQYPIVPSRWMWDNKGIAHQYVDVNDVAVLTWQKDHEDNCRRCGGKMTVDARESRALGRRGIFRAIWELDNTHVMLMLVFVIIGMAMTGAFFWAYMNDTKHTAELEASKRDVTRQANIIAQYQNITGITIGK